MDVLGVLGDHGFMATTNTITPKVIDAPQDLKELLNLSKFLESHDSPALLLGPDGEQVPLPLAVYEVLRQVATAMERGSSVSVQPLDRQLTTQQAAELLGISRNTLIRLLDEHELAFERLGASRHRRLRLSDVLAYRERKRQDRGSRLNEMTRQAFEDGLYDVDGADYQSALRAARKG